MEELTIKYPKDLELTVNLTKAEMEQHLRLMAALKMYELGKISALLLLLRLSLFRRFISARLLQKS